MVSNRLFAGQQQILCRVTLRFVSAEQQTFCLPPTAFFTSTYLAPYDTHPAYMAGYTPRDIAAVISGGICHGYLRLSRVNSPKLRSDCNSEETDTPSIPYNDYH